MPLASGGISSKPGRSSAADPQVGLRGQGLLNALRAGGYAIYFRHGLTDTTQQDRQRFDASDCASQRNLSAAGRQQVAKIGAALQAMRLPLGEILASPFCRTMETARLVAGTPVALEAIRGKASAAGGGRDYRELESLLAKPVGGPALRILVGHGNGFAAAAGDPHLEEGEAAVLRAVEGGGWIVIARVQPGDWDALAALAR